MNRPMTITLVRRRETRPADVPPRIRSWSPLILLFFLSLSLLPLPAVVPIASQKASEAELRRAESLFREGRKKLAKQRLDEARALFLQSIDIFPELAGARVEIGHIHLLRGEYRDALRELTRARDAYARLLALQTSWKTRSRNAQRDFIQAGQDAQDTFGAGSCGWPARIYGGDKEARQEENRKVGMEPDEPDIPALFYLYMGIACRQCGDVDRAEREFRTGLTRDPKLAPLHFELAVLLLVKGDPEAAAAEARAAGALGFKVPEAFKRDLEQRKLATR